MPMACRFQRGGAARLPVVVQDARRRTITIAAAVAAVRVVVAEADRGAIEAIRTK